MTLILLGQTRPCRSTVFAELTAITSDQEIQVLKGTIRLLALLTFHRLPYHQPECELKVYWSEM